MFILLPIDPLLFSIIGNHPYSYNVSRHRDERIHTYIYMHSGIGESDVPKESWTMQRVCL
jgi:hypothetical protein